MDIVAKITRRQIPMTGEGIEIATRFHAMEDSKQITALGVEWRDPAETRHDLFQWFFDQGRLPPHAVPALSKISR